MEHAGDSSMSMTDFSSRHPVLNTIVVGVLTTIVIAEVIAMAYVIFQVV